MAKETAAVVRDATTEVVEQSDSATSFEVRIRVHDAPASPTERTLANGSIVLGAGLGADLVISDESVSRRHLQITASPRGVELVDLESRNGTFYQGQRVGRLTLDREATIALGRVRVTVSPQLNTGDTAACEQSHYGELRGGSPAMQQLYDTLRRLENSTVSVLIEGESDTGKELVARMLHEHSPVRQGPWVVLHCAATEAMTIRSELLGHRRGAFPGAEKDRQGVLEQANGGTLLLDDIDALPLDMQTALLRVLTTKQVVPVGDTEPRGVSVRVIATSTRTLRDAIDAGRFSKDLFYQLSVVSIRVPALRERPEDVAVLARHFTRQLGILRLPPAVIEQLERHVWSGNVRELRNVLQAYAAIGELPRAPIDGDEQLAEMLRRVLDVERPYHQQKDQIVNRFIDVYLSMLLEYTGGNQSAAARLSGIDRAHLNKMIAKFRKEST